MAYIGDKMIIVKINNYEVREKEFNYQLEKLMRQLHIDTATIDVKNRAIEQLIDAYLLLEYARTESFNIEQEEIDNTMLDFMLQFENENDFQNMLERYQMCQDDIINRTKDKIAIRKYIQSHFSDIIEIPEDKLLDVYNENKEAFTTKETVKVSHILIADLSLESKLKITEIRQSIESFSQFMEIANRISECPSGCQYGDLGYIPRGQMIKEFDDIVFNLEINEISQPFTTLFGYHIAMVTDKRPSQIAPFDSIKKALKKRLMRIDTELRILKHIKELRQQATIQIFLENLS